MFDYLSQFSRVRVRERDYVLEEDSYTTYDNIRLAAARIATELQRMNMKWEERMATKVKITVFCEAQRALKVAMLTRHFLYTDRRLVKDVDDIQIETYNWERADPNRELKTTVKTWLAIKYPWLGLAERERRRRIRRSFQI